MIRTTDRSLIVSAFKKFVDLATSTRMLEAMEDADAILLEEVQANVNVDKGDLRDDANARIVSYEPGKRVQGGVSMMKNGKQRVYAWQVDRGGTIYPRPENKTGRLWFMNRNGQLIGVKSVTQKGSFYMERSLENKKDKIIDKLKEGVTGAFHVFD